MTIGPDDIEELLIQRIEWHRKRQVKPKVLPLTAEEFSVAESYAMAKAMDSKNTHQVALAMNNRPKELWFMGVKLVKTLG